MKRIILMVLVCCLVAICSCFAEDLGINIIGVDDDNVTLDLDDIQLGKTYKIDGYVKLLPIKFEFVDRFAQYAQGSACDNSKLLLCYDGDYVYIENPGDTAYSSMNWNDSGVDADFAWFTMDITNLKHTSIKILSEAEVVVFYGEDDNAYEFSGWIRQFNYDYNQSVYSQYHEGVAASAAVLHPQDEEEIRMLYTGNYAFGCTLPMDVINDKKTPLKMIITLGGNELTYYIRR